MYAGNATRAAAVALLAWTSPAFGDAPGGAPAAEPRWTTAGGAARVPLILRSAATAVRIDGAVATVTVTQRWRHTGRRPLDGVLAVDAGPRAAPESLVVRTGGRTIAADACAGTRGADVDTYAYADAPGDHDAVREPADRGSACELGFGDAVALDVPAVAPGAYVDVELRYVEVAVAVAGRHRVALPGPVVTRTRRRPAPPEFTVDLPPAVAATVTSPTHALSLVSADDGPRARLATGESATRAIVLDWAADAPAEVRHAAR